MPRGSKKSIAHLQKELIECRRQLEIQSKNQKNDKEKIEQLKEQLAEANRKNAEWEEKNIFLYLQLISKVTELTLQRSKIKEEMEEEMKKERKKVEIATLTLEQYMTHVFKMRDERNDERNLVGIFKKKCENLEERIRNGDGPKRQFHCDICYEEYKGNVPELTPRILYCGHTVCYKCAQGLCRKNVLQCPFDRRAWEVSDPQRLNRLPINFSLLSP